MHGDNETQVLFHIDWQAGSNQESWCVPVNPFSQNAPKTATSEKCGPSLQNSETLQAAEERLSV